MVRTGGVITPRPLAIENTPKPCAIGRRNGVVLANSWSMWIGLKSPLKPAKLTMSVSVIVRPPEVHSWPTSMSSKYRWIEEKLIDRFRDGGLREGGVSAECIVQVRRE